jgi:cation diffusion facilitator family transporter
MSENIEQLNSHRLERYDQVRKVLWWILVANVLVTLVKIIVGLVSGILAIVADGFHSLVDASSNLIGLAAINLARRPADEKHPYGYQRYETLGAFLIGVFMLLAAWEIASQIIENLQEGTQQEVSVISLILMTITFAINLGVVLTEKRAGKRLKSEVLLADARHTQTDLYITGSVVLSLVGMWLGWLWLDSVVAVIVVALIVRAAFGILLEASQQLADKSVIDIEKIAEIAYSVPHVRFVHHIRSRGTADAAFVDLHVKVNGAMSISQAHGIGSEVERRLVRNLEGVKDALVHIEPAKNDRPTRWESIAYNLRELAEGMGLGMHDLHIHAGEESEDFTVEIHLEFESGISLGEAHRTADEFEKEVLKRWSQVGEVITHLEPLPQQVLHSVERSDPGLEARVVSVLDNFLRTDQLRTLQLYHSGGHLHAVIVICLDENMPLTDAHDFSEKIEIELRKQVPKLDRVTLHIEPCKGKEAA